MAFGKKRGTAVLLDDRSVRVVEAEILAGRLTVLHAARAVLGDEEKPTSARMGELLRQALDSAGCRGDTALAVLPAGRVLFRRFELPKGDEAEVEQMIRFQAKKVLPLGESAMKVAYFLQDGLANKIDITVVGVLHDVLAHAEETFTAAGLKLEAVTVSSLGALHALGGADGLSALVDVGLRTSDVTVVSGTKLLYTRSCPVGETSSEGVERLATEVQLSIRSALADHPQKTPARILLAGREGRFPGLGKLLGERLGVEGTQTPPPGNNIEWKTPGVDGPAVFLPLAGALAADMTRTGPTLDLRGEFFTKADRKKGKSTSYLVAATAICLLAALFLVPDQILTTREKELKTLRSEVEILEKEDLARVEGLAKKAQELRSWTRERAHWLDVLLEITQRKPEKKGQTSWGVYITTLRFREKEPIRLNGRARSESDITSYARALQRSAMFRSADMTGFQKSDRKGDYPFSYEIVARLGDQDVEEGK